jgi:hypothetical protein
MNSIRVIIRTGNQIFEENLWHERSSQIRKMTESLSLRRIFARMFIKKLYVLKELFHAKEIFCIFKKLLFYVR